MRRSILFALILTSALFGGCDKLDREGMVLVLDSSLRAEVVLGNADGISSPDGLLWWEGTLYIADEGGSAIRAWTPGGRVRTLAEARHGLSSPEDLARDAAGNLYATDDDTGGVWRVSARGDVASVARARTATSTEGLAISPNGTLLVGDQRGRRILAVERGGGGGYVLLSAEAGIRKPEGLAFDDRGNLYIADNTDNTLYMLGGDGALSRPVTNRSSFSPESLYFADGALYITDSAHGKLFRYTTKDGLVTIAVFGGTLSNVQGITIDEMGNIYVSVQSDLTNARGYVLRLSHRPSS